MTRISFGIYRSGVQEPALRLAAGGANTSWPTPASIQRATLTRHHRDGPDAARQYMVASFERSNYWGPNGTPQSRGWASTTVQSYDNYAQMTSGDTRAMVSTSLERDLDVLPNVIGVRIDVLLLDPAGYVPRIVLWDKNELTAERATLYAAPVLLAVEEELGGGRVAETEVLHLRSRLQLIVSNDDALSVAQGMETVVSRLLSR